MPSNSDVIKEFLVKLGWTHDEASRKKVTEAEAKTTEAFQREQKARELINAKEQRNRETSGKKQSYSVSQTLKEFAKITAVAEAMALGVTAAVERMARSFERAYYQSSRSNSSVREINAFTFAASQMGSSAEEASSAIEGLGKAQRDTNNGWSSLLRKYGASDPTNIAKSLMEIAPAVGALSRVQGEAVAKQLHIPENILLSWEKNAAEFQKFGAESSKKYNILGFDPQKAASDGKALTQIFRNLYDTVEKIGESIGSKLFGDLKGPIADLNDYLLAHGKEIANVIVKIADALFKMLDYLVRNLPRLDRFVQSIGGWSTALTILAGIISAAFVGRVLGLLGALRGIAGLGMAPWMLKLLGIPGVAVGAATVGAGAAGVAALRALPEDQQDQVLERHEAIQQLREHKLAGSWNKTKQMFGYGKPSGNDQLWARSHKGQQAIKAAGRAWNEGGQGNDVSNSGGSGNLTRLTEDAAREAGIDPRIMHGIRAGESGHGRNYDVGDGKSSFGPWQLHYGGINPAMPHPGLGDDFTRDTGLDARDPKTIPAQTRWVAHWLKKHSPVGTWFGYHGNRDASPKWGDSGYVPDPIKKGAAVAPVVSRQKTGDADWQNHRSGKVPMPVMSQWGKFDPDRLRAQMGAARPLGGNPTDSSKNVQMHQTNHVTVSGVSDPTAAAAQIGARHDKHSSLLLRNMQSAIA